MQLRELFTSDVTRDIAPVVYFHEQSPDKIAEEVGEYIVTGGYPREHPHHQRVPDGIHEQYVSLLGAIVEELGRAGGPDLPASWISGFYGSGKSSFAKLLGLALDGVALPDGRSVAEALLARDTSPRATELREAWDALRRTVDPVAVVFDIGGLARDNEHIHSAVVRQVQKRLGYCAAEALVADFELKIERDGDWQRFAETAERVLGQPWAEVKDRAMAEEDFSLVMSELYPERYTDPMSWFESRAGTAPRGSSVEEATRAIADMLACRAPGKTLFVVVDEVSQYIHQDQQRMLKLQSFVSELGQRLKGRAWLLVTGQQKLEEADETDVLGKLKGRFKPRLRVHLAPTNIRDVVHKRLLQKRPEAEAKLRELFRKHRTDLKLFAYECEDITEEDFVEVYPLLPGHVDLLLQITTALRTRSSRSQGDDQAIRGLLQLLGELFRREKLAEQPLGSLVTLDRIYEVQHTALDSDVQNSMMRILNHCADHGLPLAARAAKAVALLELVQDGLPTHPDLVARCLFDDVDRGKQDEAVTEALEALRSANLLAFSEKHGYKIQSSSGEEWERERRDLAIPREELVGLIQEALKYLQGQPTRPSLAGRTFPWMAYFSDGQRASDVVLVDPRDPANVTVDFRMLPAADRTPAEWVNRSADKPLNDRIVWVAGDPGELETQARDLARAHAMVRRYKPRRESLSRDRQRLLLEEEARAEELERRLHAAVDTAWMAGTVYFRGQSVDARDLGAAFGTALAAAGHRFLPLLYPSFLPAQVTPAELEQLIQPVLTAPSPKFVDDLGLLSLDAGQYVPTCHGAAPTRVMELIEQEGGIGGNTLLTHFGGPPYGYVGNVVRVCVVALLRAGRVRIQPDSGATLTAVRDAGVREIFEKDRGFRRASIAPAGEGAINAKDRVRICRLFEDRLGQKLQRQNDAIADAVAQHFPNQAERLRDVLTRLQRLRPVEDGAAPVPHALARLGEALEACGRVVRQTEPAVQAVKRHFDALNDGLEQLGIYAAELTDEAVEQVRRVGDVVAHQLDQLEEAGDTNGELSGPAGRLREQLASERPWRDIGGCDADVQAVLAAYAGARRHLLAEQEAAAEAIRGRIRARAGFSTLTSDQSHHVLRPVTEALLSTSEDAVAPGLTALRDSVRHRLEDAEETANERLDQILSEGDRPQVRKLPLNLRNREVATEAELDQLLADVRERVQPELAAGRRVRFI